MSKFIAKKSNVLRVELEMRSRFLRHYKINDPYDFGKLVGILPQRHIHFVRLNQKKLAARLLRTRLRTRPMWEILDDVRLLDGDVWSTLNFLRQDVGIKNARRLLDPLDTNDVVLDALKKWAAQWPAAPASLKRK